MFIKGIELLLDEYSSDEHPLLDESVSLSVEKKIKGNKITHRLTLKTDIFNAETMNNLKKELLRIAKDYDAEKRDVMAHTLYIILKVNFFADKSVVMIIESLIYALSSNRDFRLYINVKIPGDYQQHLFCNFYELSFLKTVVTKFISSHEYCYSYKMYKGNLHARENIGHFRYFIDTERKENILLPSKLESDINSLLKYHFESKKDIIDDICTIVGELSDNIVAHTHGQGVVEIAYIPVYKKDDDCDINYFHFMINVINFSKEKLYSNIIKCYTGNNMDELMRQKIKKAYDIHKKYFDDGKYTENLFFMVSAFQNGTTTRKTAGGGGTGLNKVIKKFSKKSQSDEKQGKVVSYVYSGCEILSFDKRILSSTSLGDSIAFNKSNNYNEIPDENCVTNSSFHLDGTAYNLMFIIKEDDL